MTRARITLAEKSQQEKLEQGQNKYILFIERQKNTLKRFGPRTWCTKNLLVIRVIHQNSLTSYPGQTILVLVKKKVGLNI